MQNLAANGVIRSSRVAEAMKKVDRADYTDSGAAYSDSPQPIGSGQTISAPHMHAEALENLVDAVLKPGAKVLDVGSGSGYLCACLAHLNPSAKVIGIDRIQSLVELSKRNLRKHDGALLEEGRIELHTGDGWAGWPQAAPFDAIHVGASADEVPPKLLTQMRVGGKMIIPVGSTHGYQTLLMVERLRENNDSGDFETKNIADVRFVPLVKGL